MFACIDLDLEAQTNRRNVLGHETVAERHPSFRLFPARFAKPGIENASQGIHHRTGRSGPDLNQIDILGVARGRSEVELVERCASPEGHCPGQNSIGKYLDQSATDDQVLLDLEILAPWRPPPPFE